MDKILTPIKQRVSKYLENQRITKVSFCEKTGISASNFKGKAMKSELGGDKIAKILTFYKDINPYWLLLGEGEMLCDKSKMLSKGAIHLANAESTENTIEDILAKKINLLMKPNFDTLRSDLNLLTKNVISARLDIDDIKDEIVEQPIKKNEDRL